MVTRRKLIQSLAQIPQWVASYMAQLAKWAGLGLIFMACVGLGQIQDCVFSKVTLGLDMPHFGGMGLFSLKTQQNRHSEHKGPVYI